VSGRRTCPSPGGYVLDVRGLLLRFLSRCADRWSTCCATSYQAPSGACWTLFTVRCAGHYAPV